MSKEDRTSKFEQWRIATATCTVPASSSSRDDAAVRGSQVLSKQPSAEAPQTPQASPDARSPGASSAAAATENAIPRKRKFFSVSQGMFVIGSDSQSGESDAEASDGGSIAEASSRNAVPDSQVLSKAPRAEAPQKPKASPDARSPGASSAAAGTENVIPRKRKFFSVS